MDYYGFDDEAENDIASHDQTNAEQVDERGPLASTNSSTQELNHTTKASASRPSHLPVAEDTHQSDTPDTPAQSQKVQRKSAAGRELLRWDPDKDQLTLLCVDYVCALDGYAIKWDKVAEVMGELVGKPNMTGEAIKQHMTKLYNQRSKTPGYPVPPKLGRNQRHQLWKTEEARKKNHSQGRKWRRTEDVDDESQRLERGANLLVRKPFPRPIRVEQPQSESDDEIADGISDDGARYDDDPQLLHPTYHIRAQRLRHSHPVSKAGSQDHENSKHPGLLAMPRPTDMDEIRGSKPQTENTVVERQVKEKEERIMKVETDP